MWLQRGLAFPERHEAVAEGFLQQSDGDLNDSSFSAAVQSHVDKSMDDSGHSGLAAIGISEQNCSINTGSVLDSTGNGVGPVPQASTPGPLNASQGFATPPQGHPVVMTSAPSKAPGDYLSTTPNPWAPAYCTSGTPSAHVQQLQQEQPRYEYQHGHPGQQQLSLQPARPEDQAALQQAISPVRSGATVDAPGDPPANFFDHNPGSCHYAADPSPCLAQQFQGRYEGAEFAAGANGAVSNTLQPGEAFVDSSSPGIASGEGAVTMGSTFGVESAETRAGRVLKRKSPGRNVGAAELPLQAGASEATPEAIGMQKLVDHKHWAAVYIKPNRIYRKRSFSSLKDRKKRDLVAAAFAVFHKICESISNGEAEDLMRAVLSSTHLQRIQKDLRQEDNKLKNAFLKQQATLPGKWSQELLDSLSKLPTLAYQLAPAGPNGRTRVLTTLVKLMPTLDIQRLFHQEHSKPPSEYELNLARGQFAASGAADQPPPQLIPSPDQNFEACTQAALYTALAAPTYVSSNGTVSCGGNSGGFAVGAGESMAPEVSAQGAAYGGHGHAAEDHPNNNPCARSGATTAVPRCIPPALSSESNVPLTLPVGSGEDSEIVPAAETTSRQLFTAPAVSDPSVLTSSAAYDPSGVGSLPGIAQDLRVGDAGVPMPRHPVTGDVAVDSFAYGVPTAGTSEVAVSTLKRGRILGSHTEGVLPGRIEGDNWVIVPGSDRVRALRRRPPGATRA